MASNNSFHSLTDRMFQAYWDEDLHDLEHCILTQKADIFAEELLNRTNRILNSKQFPKNVNPGGHFTLLDLIGWKGDTSDIERFPLSYDVEISGRVYEIRVTEEALKYAKSIQNNQLHRALARYKALSPLMNKFRIKKEDRKKYYDSELCAETAKKGLVKSIHNLDGPLSAQARDNRRRSKRAHL